MQFNQVYAEPCLSPSNNPQRPGSKAAGKLSATCWFRHLAWYTPELDMVVTKLPPFILLSPNPMDPLQGRESLWALSREDLPLGSKDS